MRHDRIYSQLFASFVRIGAFTFGGGWAMISLIEREVVENRKWIEREEFLDLLAAVGDRLRGMKGSIAAALGTIMPCFFIILAIAVFLTPEVIQNNHVVSAIFRGIRPAVVALIIAPVITTAKASKIGWKTVWIPIVVALLIWSHWPVVSNPILYIIIGGLAGFLWLRRQEKRLTMKQIDEKESREGL